MAVKTEESAATAVAPTSSASVQIIPVPLGVAVAQTSAQSTEAKAYSSTGWKWTKKKRKAVQLVLKGWPDTRIAKDLGVHRNTVRAWRSTQEFAAATMTEARDYMQRVRFKRVTETGIVTDQIASQVARRLAGLTDDAGRLQQLGQVDLNALQLFLREYREFREQERADFGDNVRRFEGNFHVGVTGGSEATVLAKGAQSFKRFVTENADKIPERALSASATPQEALVAMTRELLKKTDLLDALHSEDNAEDGAGGE